MKVAALLLLLCACVAADLAAVKSAKAKFLGKLARAKHHKRGVLATIPTFKLGHDIPHVSHSVIKPLLVTYPPTALPVSVKVPLHNPLIHHHKPFFHKHHHKAQEHFHHHHHHLTRPAVPLLPAPPAPLIPAPSVPVPVPVPVPVAQPVPAPPLLLRPTIVPTLLPRPVGVVPPHLHLRPVLQAPVALPPAPLFPAPAPPQLSYVIRPGNAVQTSYFATYPKYPFYQTPAVPVAPPVFLGRPAQLPLPLVPGFAQTTLQPTPTLLHPTNIIPTQPSVHLDHNGWSPIQAHAHDAGHHLVQDHLAHDQAHFAHDQAVQQLAHEQAHFAHDQAQHYVHDQAQHYAHDQAQHYAHDQAQHYAHDQAQLAHDQAHHFAHDQAQHYAHDQAQHYALDQAQFAQDQAHHLAHDQAHFAHDQAHFAQEQAQHYAHDQAQFAHDQAHLAHDQAQFAHDQAQFAHDQAHLAHDQTHLVHDQSHYPDQGKPIYEEQQEDFHHQYQGQDPGYHYPGPVGRSGDGGDEEKEGEHNVFPSSLQPPIDESQSQFN